MPGTSRNRDRVAELCSEATGVSFRTTRRWAAEGLITRRQPVPDAADPAQRAFEARIALTVGEALRDSQLDGAVLGVKAAVPAPEGLTLKLHERMARRVLGALLPRYDEDYGGLRGVPGLRVGAEDGRLVLRDVVGGGRVRLEGANASARLPQDGDGLRYVGRFATRSLHATERGELPYWTGTPMAGPDPRSRDYLLSRLLRRPQLVNLTAQAHGWVNSYCHQYQDLVLEWCCGPTASAVTEKLMRSGLDAAVAEGAGRVAAPHPRIPGVIRLGGAEVYVRCLHLTHTELSGDWVSRIAESIERRYA
ncbi:hypothetical protein ACQKM2_31505 [Streptomyces sp. NPDC004126]|uniref:hypothetical protein n=1 Tax=Streptomyces sp. NPDC004126 TaxID=3390695 RepID=UPI003CFEEA33